MAEQVIIDPNELEAFIAALIGFNNELASQASNLGGSFQQLGESWRDDAYLRFAEYFQDLTDHLRRFQQTTESDTLPYLQRILTRTRELRGTYR